MSESNAGSTRTTEHDHAIEQTVGKFIDQCSARGLGTAMRFAVAAGDSGKDITIRLQGVLPEVQEHQMLAGTPAHTFLDILPFLQWIEHWQQFMQSDGEGDALTGQEPAIIFVRENAIWGILDDYERTRGDRTMVRVEGRLSDEYNAWQDLLVEGGDGVGHKDLVLFIRRWEHTLSPASRSALEQLASVGFTASVKSDSVISEVEKGLSVTFQAKAGERLATIPRTIDILVPVFADDIDPDQHYSFVVRLMPDLPDRADGQLRFYLSSSNFHMLMLMRERRVVDDLVETLGTMEEAPNVLVSRGFPDYPAPSAMVRTEPSIRPPTRAEPTNNPTVRR